LSASPVSSATTGQCCHLLSVSGNRFFSYRF
jgi:hypothetical protein